jgi:hypothetical protein
MAAPVGPVYVAVERTAKAARGLREKAQLMTLAGSFRQPLAAAGIDAGDKSGYALVLGA